MRFSRVSYEPKHPYGHMDYYPEGFSKYDLCYGTERGYIPDRLSHLETKPSETYQIPSTLVNLAQIVAYFKDPEFARLGELSSKWFDARAMELAVHNYTKKLVSEEPSKLDAEIDRIFRVIESFSDEAGSNEALVKSQLLPKKGFLIKAIRTEAALAESDENSVVFWRFSNEGFSDDLKKFSINYTSSDKTPIKPAFSFGDSLLAGYIHDGMNYSSIDYGTENTSACVFTYFDVHSQAREIKRTGTYKGKPLAETSRAFKDYISKVNKNELYGIKLTFEKAKALAEAKRLAIPKNTESSSACFQSGEEFHPTLKLSEDLEVVTLYRGSDMFDLHAVD